LFETVTEAAVGVEDGLEQTMDVEETKVADTWASLNLQVRSFEKTKSEPVIVTAVDPVEGPESGEREVMATGAV
jgi:hypothetical protein